MMFHFSLWWSEGITGGGEEERRRRGDTRGRQGTKGNKRRGRPAGEEERKEKERVKRKQEERKQGEKKG